MSGEIRAIVDNLITQIEAVTPTTTYDGISTFEINHRAWDDSDIEAASRMVWLEIDPGSRTVDRSVQGAEQDVGYVSIDINVHTAYKLGDDAVETQTVIAEDVDAMQLRVENIQNWDKSNTKLINVTASIYEILGLEDAEAGDMVASNLPVTCKYTMGV